MKTDPSRGSQAKGAGKGRAVSEHIVLKCGHLEHTGLVDSGVLAGVFFWGVGFLKDPPSALPGRLCGPCLYSRSFPVPTLSQCNRAILSGTPGLQFPSICFSDSGLKHSSHPCRRHPRGLQPESHFPMVR